MFLGPAAEAQVNILGGKGGGGSAPATQAAQQAAQQAAAAAAQAAQQSVNSLSRATQAIQAMRAAQSAARNLAVTAPTTVTNGLSPGCLVVDPRVGTDPSLWVNASKPTETTSNGQTTVTIEQQAQRAILTWQQFDVGKNTTVDFDQRGNASWIALNRIDATGSPSQILGSIKADGTVLIINPNGIIFGGASQINVNSLIATSLDIDGTPASSVFNKSPTYTQVNLNGLTGFVPPNEDASNANFVANGLFSVASKDWSLGKSAMFAMGDQTLSTAALPGIPGTGGGAITVQPGASITTAVDASGNGGYVALIGPRVTNSGHIAVQDGQIILAASSGVALTNPLTTATGINIARTVSGGVTGGDNGTSATDSSPGLLSTFDPPSLEGGGLVTNDGSLRSSQGAITILGDSINQLGLAEATTGVQRIGSIALATIATSNGTGNIVFGPNSVTSILPDAASGTVPQGAATGLQPKISIKAFGGVDFQSGSLLVAPSTALNISSRSDVLLESGATINLAGLTDVQVPVTDALVTFIVTANEVANSPLAKNLIGQTVTIDTRLSGTRSDGIAWVGSPVVDATGYANLIPESIYQVLTAGGSISINGGTSPFIQQPGSVVNVSGGYVSYAGGIINTTKLLGSDGRTYDIGHANPNIGYVGFAGKFTVSHPHWGVTETFTNPLLTKGYYDPGSLAGASAGAISIATVPFLDGTMIGDTVTGDRQLANANAGLTQLPTAASLSLNGPFAYLLETAAQAGNDPYGLSSYTFGSGLPGGSGPLPLLTDKLNDIGFGSISIGGAGGAVNMAAGSVLTVAPGGSVSLTGVQTINGTINAPAGKITLSGYTYDSQASAGVQNLPPVTIGAGAVLNVAGRWVNDMGAYGGNGPGSAFINGGSVSISTTAAAFPNKHDVYGNDFGNVDVTQSIVLAPGSIIDVSGGGHVSASGKLTGGASGSVSLQTYTGGWIDPVTPYGGSRRYNQAPNGGNEPNAATVVMGGTIYAEGFGNGGTFTLQAPTITIDGAATAVTSYTSGPNSGEIVLPTSSFTGNGFSNYALSSAYGSTTLTAGTRLLLQQSNYLPSASLLALPTGAAPRDNAAIGVLPDGLRNPVSLSLTQLLYDKDPTDPTSTTATVLIGQGASIVGEANASKQASITLYSVRSAIELLGGIAAPGGSITLTGDSWIGPNAVLDVSGTYVPNPAVADHQAGSVLNGGTITLTGPAIVAEAGSQFRLDGTSGQTQIPSGSIASGQRFVTKQIWSDGGKLHLSTAAQGRNDDDKGLYFAGTVSAKGGGPDANGGTLDIKTGSIVVEPAGLIAANLPGSTLANATPAQLLSLLPGNGGAVFIGSDTLDDSGLSSLSLSADAVAFNGSISIKVPGSLILSGNPTLLPRSSGLLPDGLSSGALAWIGYALPASGDTVVDLTAGYVRMSGEDVKTPSAGGTLNVAADWIDIGSPDGIGTSLVNLVNVGSATFTSADAIRLVGSQTAVWTEAGTESILGGGLFAAGDLTLQAAEIYPTSGTKFVLMSTGPSGHLTINQVGTARRPLSAGGTLVLDAATITQNGTLWAPFGQIVAGLSESSSPYFTDLIQSVDRNGLGPTPTQNVAIGAGSLTSVSGNGSLLPYGITVDGATWYGGNVSFDKWYNTYTGTKLTASPVKAVSLSGANVTTAAGAVLDLSGGGDLYATEFVSGTGGTQNVLAGGSVYALVPTSTAKVAPYDPTFDTFYGSSLLDGAPGQAITIAGGNGIPAGTYTLMPGMYATLPGAYRVTVASNNITTATPVSAKSQDGSVYVSGTFANAITGARSSQTVLFQIQPKSTWSTYSQIDITSGTRFITKRAATNGTATPNLPIDGGTLTLAATNTLSSASTNFFAAGASSLDPGASGRGGQVAISADSILVLAPDQTAPAADAGYLVLNSDTISNLGASTVILGASSTIDSSGNLALTGVTANLEVDTDTAHALSGPQLILVTSAGGSGITIDDGSVIAARGSVPAGDDRNITVNGDGSLLRVSNGAMVSTTRSGTLAHTGNIAIGHDVTINGGNALTLDSSGNNSLGANVTLTAKAYDLSGSSVNFGAPAGTPGLDLSAANIANFAGATSILLRSASVFNFYDQSGLAIGDATNPIGMLTFDGAGLYSQGGTTTIHAANIVLTDSQGTPNTTGALTGTNGTLTLAASNTITPGTGAFVLGGFGQINIEAGRAINFAGQGSLNAGGANVTVTAPDIVALAGSRQSVTTTGGITIASNGTATPVDPTTIGGSLTLTGGSIIDTGTLTALSGTLSLVATSGDISLGGGAVLNAAGSEIVLGPVIEDTPGGTVNLLSRTGNVTLNPGSLIDVAAAGNGYAGSLNIVTALTGTTTLNGALQGGAAFAASGGSFALSTGRVITGGVAGALPVSSGFTRSFEASIYQPGDLTVAAAQTLTSGNVLLVANQGSVVVGGTIDASGPTGGTIQLYGAGTTDAGHTTGGVFITSGAQLLATYKAPAANDPNYANGTSTLVRNGGTITLGTTGYWDGVSLNSDGSELVRPGGSGTITVASGALIDVSGGTGGHVNLRAPITTDTKGFRNVNVSVYKGASDSVIGASSVALNAYEVWSTADPISGTTFTDAGGTVGSGTHFDGIIDPAGWFNANGTQIAGTTDATTGIFTPTGTINSNHVTFYQTTLLGFVNDPFSGNTGSVSANFGSNVAAHLRPEIDLVNPTPSTGPNSINGGNITVNSNWNLGAGTENSAGLVQLYYRTVSGEPGALILRAANNINVNATISDGFFLQYLGTPLPPILPPSDVLLSATDYYNQESAQLANDNYQIDSDGNPVFFGDYWRQTFTFSQMFGGGTYIPLNLLGPGQLQAPTTFQNPTNDPNVASLIDQYNQYYYQYTQLFDVYASETVADEGYYGIPSGTAPYLPPPAPTTANNYYNFVTGPQPGVGEDYVSQYQSYFNNAGHDVNGASPGVPFAGIVWTDTCYPCAAYAPPFAPYPQLASSLQAGYTPHPVTLPAHLSGPVTADAIATIQAQALDAIANNPLQVNVDPLYGINPIYNSTSATPLMTDAVSGKGSFSYNFTAGAYMPVNGTASVNPGATLQLFASVDPANPSASIVISGHTSYQDPLDPSQTVYVPTLVRTGTGSITLNTPGDVLFTDPIVQGAVYTAGAPAPTPSDFAAPTPGAGYTNTPNGLVSTPQWGTGGGAITVNAGQSIIANTGLESENTADWYYRNGASDGSATPFSACAGAGAPACQTAAWVNYATFFQMFGALGGGNISLRAGGDITNISAALPESLLVSGGTNAGDPPVEHFYGGGDLLVQAGGNLSSGSFYVGRGSGIIGVTGAVQGAQLSVQDSYVTVVAGGSLGLGVVSDPSRIISDGYGNVSSDYVAGLTPNLFGYVGIFPQGGTSFTSYGPQSGVSLTSLGGGVTFLAEATNMAWITPLLPPSLSITAPLGDITFNRGALLIAYPTDAAGHDTGALALAAGGSIYLPDYGFRLGYMAYINPLGFDSFSYAPETLATSAPAVLYAGQDISGGLRVNRPAFIQAGRNISAGFTGLNLTDDDVTSIIAGQDITSSITLYGPGALLVEAGRNIQIGQGEAIVAIGNGSASGGGYDYIPYLPAKGADITTLFGVGPGVDYASAISQYIDPAHAGTKGINFLADIAGILGQSPDQAWTTFQGLSAARQHVLVDRAFLDFLTEVATDYRKSSSPYFGQYSRAYTAIDRLFPASLGYTANLTGGALGAASTVSTGDLAMPFALLETQQQGDINIIGPGGGIRAGTAGRDTLKPDQEGILTLGGGSIRIFTDQTVLVNQSRIMTEQGGDVDIFNANGNIDAGSGPKTFASNPVISEICDADGYCFINPAGLVTGAGIAAVVTLPAQDPKKSNVTLVAPHGFVDAGAAGVRSANDLNIIARLVLNAYNIQVGGTAVGIPTFQAPNISGLTQASNTGSAAVKDVAASPNQSAPSEQPSIIIVEVIGYGGGDGSSEPAPNDKHKKGEKQSQMQDPAGRVQVLDVGEISDERRRQLVEDKRRQLEN